MTSQLVSIIMLEQNWRKDSVREVSINEDSSMYELTHLQTGILEGRNQNQRVGNCRPGQGQRRRKITPPSAVMRDPIAKLG
jgi:hypothetical protein